MPPRRAGTGAGSERHAGPTPGGPLFPRAHVQRLRQAVRLDPRLAVAPKAALAAVLAWLAVWPLGGVADDYPYYAPLGAVVASSTTVVSSLRATGQTALALALGAFLALAVLSTDLPTVAALALVVAIGTWLGGWSRIAAVSTWVPISGLFVLILGHDDPRHYVAAYLGLTILGALVGTAVNLTFPSLPLLSARAVQDSLRGTLAEQLEELAEGLAQDPPPTREEWRDRRREIDPRTKEMSQAATLAVDAQRANWRARYWRETAERQYRQARALEQLAFFVEEITSIVVEAEHAYSDAAALGPELRPVAAEVLRASADLLRSVDKAGAAEPVAWQLVHDRNERLAELIKRRRSDTDGEFFMAGSLVTAVRRTLAGLSPERRSAETSGVE